MTFRSVFYLPLALGTLLTAALPVQAAGVLSTEALNPTRPGNPSNVRLSDIVYTGFNVFLWVTTAVAVFYLVYAGFQYITAGGDSEKATKARSAIINAIIGIVIVMGSFFILNAARNVGASPIDTTLSNL